jgi:heme o synthase
VCAGEQTWSRAGRAAYLELTKPRVTGMVLFTAAAGVYLASLSPIDPILLLHFLVGTGLLAAGTAALNQFMEREADARMRRTSARPLPSGRVTPAEAMIFGMFLVFAGTLYLLVSCNLLTAFLGWLTSTVYLAVYTPMKTRTPACTLVGAVPGALPPVMGWAAVRGDLNLDACFLFLILFCWQFPHFLAIAWIYREDYERGGFRMLPLGDEGGRKTGRNILLSTIVLLSVSQAPYWTGLSGQTYLAVSLLLGGMFGWYSLHVFRTPTKPSARRLLKASVIYLPLLLFFLTLDKIQ